MDFSDTSVSVLELQRHLFASSLYKEMNALGKKADERNSFLLQATENYLQDGFSSDDCVDLLILDGYPSQLAKECVASCNANSSSVEDIELVSWDFVFKDAHGKVWSSREMGQSVSASTKLEAIEMAKMMISDGNDSLEEIIEVTPSNV